ncbi:MAG: hypothetical protein ACKVTZ_22520 [Bacteroidia bacterium]
MEAKVSKLSIINYHIIHSEFSVNLPDNSDDKHNHKNYPLDIDFEIIGKSKTRYSIFVVLNINVSETPLMGYSISVIGEGVFELKTNKTNQEYQINSLLYSALPIMIGNLRGYISDLTSYGALGKYLFPSIDLEHLIDLKRKEKKEVEK